MTINKSFEDEIFSEVVKKGNEILDAMGKTFKRLGKKIAPFVKALAGLFRNNKRYRSTMKAISRSQRNNEFVKKHKHGRTYKTRVRRKR